jgi:putative ABC transport system permease protein
MYVYDEQNIDRFHSNKDRIYRVIEKSNEDDGVHHYAATANPMAEAMKRDIPAVEEAGQMFNFGSIALGFGQTRIAERSWVIASPEIFNIFDIQVLSGNPAKAFSGDAGVIMETETAVKLFGDENPVGKTVETDRFGNVEVLAVMEKLPRTSTYQFNQIYILNFSQLSDGFQNFFNSWDTHFSTNYIMLKDGATPKDVYAQKEAFIEKYFEEEFRDEHDFYLQPLSEVHLGSSHLEWQNMEAPLSIPYSDHEFVSMILFMGLLVIFIAALNYINLSSVQALKRTLEASMRKINGANNRHLLVQLFFETFMTVIIAYGISLVLILIFFPYFKEISNKDFGLSLLFTLDFVPYHIGSILIIWIVSALIPAIYYSKLKRSLLILKNAFSGKGDLLRKGLVGVQYALSIFLIIGSMVIYRQLNFVQTKDLGFDNDKMIVLDINSGSARREFKNILRGIKENPNVINASTSSRVPGEWKNIPVANLTENLTDEPVEASHYAIDHNWLDTYQIDLVEGANFTGNDQSDSLYVLINQKAADMLNLENPVGTSLWIYDNDSARLKIIGVVENFHFQSLYQPIGPVVLTSWKNHIRSIDYFTIRYSQNPKQTISHIEEVNATFDPDTPPEINFLDEQWNRFYKAEQSRATIILIASIVSIIISAFGLFGLINFTVERKTKEIGIRKVMGATVPNIIKLVLKDYLVLLFISLLIAAPVAWWLFRDWLSDFAYRINLSADLFVIAFVLVLFVSFTTVLSRIFKIARANPVNSIRYE